MSERYLPFLVYFLKCAEDIKIMIYFFTKFSISKLVVFDDKYIIVAHKKERKYTCHFFPSSLAKVSIRFSPLWERREADRYLG